MGDFASYVAQRRSRLACLTLDNVSAQEIAYGRQLRLTRGSDSVTINFYYNKKNKFTTVIAGKASGLKSEVEAALAEELPFGQGKAVPLAAIAAGKKLAQDNGATLPDNFMVREEAATYGSQVQEPFNQALTVTSSISSSINSFIDGKATLLLAGKKGFDYLWAGSDESGKGDFFGPLVVAAVLLDRTGAEELIGAGVTDSKALGEKKIFELKEIIQAVAKATSVLALKPKYYNLRYAQVLAQGHKLNYLLSLGHSAALSKVLTEVSECRFCLVDEFAKHNNIAATLREQFPKVTVYQMPRGERDVAVAAASILARAEFTRIMAELSARAGCTLPKGGGAQTTACAKKIMASKGEEILGELVKKHFVNYTKVVGKV